MNDLSKMDRLLSCDHLPLPSEADTFLLFVGAPRSGTTMLGQILNNHPNCLVAMEHSFMQRLLSGDNRAALEVELVQRALGHFLHGMTKDAKYGPTLSRYQPRWKPLSWIGHKYGKADVRIIGDKKAGGNSATYLAQPEAFRQAVERYGNVKFLHLIRHPLQAALSMQRSHRESFEDSLELILTRDGGAWELGERYPDAICHVYYEDLLRHPDVELKKILTFLDLTAEQAWIDDVVQTVSPARPYPFSEEMLQAANAKVHEFGARQLAEKYFTDQIK